MKEVIERCNWLVNKCNDKDITPDVKDDFRYLLEEIERLNNIIKQYDKVSFIHEMELQKRIDKAIEYIENETTYSDYKEMDTLINILRGEDDE